MFYLDVFDYNFEFDIDVTDKERIEFMGIELNNGQLFATNDLEHWWHHSTKQVFGIEGPAGTGKTTIIRYFIERIGLELKDVLFMAYMGKAASQMIRNKLPAKTIHASCYDYVKVPAKDENGKTIYKENGKPKMVMDFVLKDRLPGKPKCVVVDEAVMVPEQNGRDILSFGVPVIVLGDNNQLPPVFGNSFFLREPDVVLNEIMRQKEGDPIIHLSQEILKGKQLKPCILGSSGVIERKYLTTEQLMDTDVIITGTNRLRGAVNKLFREQILDIENLEYPNFNEKVICRKNKWSESFKENGRIYLTNGLSGYVDNVKKSSYNGKTVSIDFKPDFTRGYFRDLKISLPYLNTDPGENKDIFISPDCNAFEYAYAITTHLSQGSQYPRVTLFQEKSLAGNREYFTRLMYTGITRAMDSIRIVI